MTGPAAGPRAPAIAEEPFGDGLVELLSRAAQVLWDTQVDRPADHPSKEAVIELGRILSGRAVLIQDAMRAAARAGAPGTPPELEREIVKDAPTLVQFIREVHHDCGWCYVVEHWEKLARERRAGGGLTEEKLAALLREAPWTYAPGWAESLAAWLLPRLAAPTPPAAP